MRGPGKALSLLPLLLAAHAAAAGPSDSCEAEEPMRASALLQVDAQWAKPQEAVKLLMHPPDGHKLNLTRPHRRHYGQVAQDLLLRPLFHGREGFFVEAGAFDGETNSNSLLFERDLGWSGLLVEPMPDSLAKLLAKHRKANVFGGCLSDDGKVKTAVFRQVGKHDKEFSTMSAVKDARSETVTATCVPLADILGVLGRSTVDLWSLDVEGAEGSILGSFDFAKIEVGVLIVEANKSDENTAAIHAVLSKNGFALAGSTSMPSGQALDRIYVNPAYFKKRGLAVPDKV